SDPQATPTCSGIVWPNSFVKRLMTRSHPTRAVDAERAPPATAATFIHSRRVVVIAPLRMWSPLPARTYQLETQSPVRTELAPPPPSPATAPTRATSRRPHAIPPPPGKTPHHPRTDKKEANPSATPPHNAARHGCCESVFPEGPANLSPTTVTNPATPQFAIIR